MRHILTAGLLLWLQGLGLAFAGTGIPVDCQVEGPVAEALCDAVRRELAQQDGLPSVQSASLVLVAQSPRSDTLRARLDVIRDGQRQSGEEGAVTVMDRAALPPGQLDDFARALIRRTGLFQ